MQHFLVTSITLISSAALCAACGGDDFVTSGHAGAGGAAGSAAAGGAAGSGGSGGNAATGGSGSSGAAGSAGDAGACDRSALPGDDNCVIAEAYGVFVAPTGDDTTGTGSMAAPFASLAKGVAAAKAAGKRVYACADGGEYAETLSLDSDADGVALFGGFACSDWRWLDANRATVASPDAVAVTLTGLTVGIRFDHFAISASDAKSAGASSYGVWVKDSQNVVFNASSISAGKGAAGEHGAPGSKGENGAPPQKGQRGADAVCGGAAVTSPGLWQMPSACGSQGGTGGAGDRNSGNRGDPGTPSTNVTPPGVDNGGAESVGAGNAGAAGSPGKPGPNGEPAQPAGHFSATGFTPAGGGAGGPGFPGQGGGGGSASAGLTTCTGAAGGAGGMGGCGGTAGGAGGGGGASVGLLSWNSSISLSDVTLTAADGGQGGDGGAGGERGAGGSRGEGGSASGGLLSAGDGGKGGDGGLGGSGSGGTGGPSLALAFMGSAPVESGNVSLSYAAPGGPGGGAQASGGVKAPDGSTGATAERADLN